MFNYPQIIIHIREYNKQLIILFHKVNSEYPRTNRLQNRAACTTENNCFTITLKLFFIACNIFVNYLKSITYTSGLN